MNNQTNSKLLPKRLLSANYAQSGSSTINHKSQMQYTPLASLNVSTNEPPRRNLSNMGIRNSQIEPPRNVDFRCEYEVPKFCDLNDPDEFPTYKPLDNRASTIASAR